MTAPQLVLQTGIYGYGMLGCRAEEDLEGTLDVIRAAAFDGIEVMSNLTGDPARLRLACAARGLDVAALHVFWDELRAPDFSELVAAIGTSRVIVSGIPATTSADVRASIPELRQRAGALRQQDVALLVHNHAEECTPLDGGSTALEILVTDVPREELGFVIDLHWAAIGGDLHRTIHSVAGRCAYYHFKDGRLQPAAAGDAISFGLGQGEVDLVGAWRTIQQCGPMEVLAVEREMPAEDLAPALRHDLGFLERLVQTSGRGT